MTIYDYVAGTNPSESTRIINSFGYSVSDNRDMGANLRHLVAQEGEPALKAVLNAHPDKDVILEAFSVPKMEPQESCSCNGKKCSCKRDDYANASGSESAGITQASLSAHQTNVFLFAAALILAVAIITKK
jgi:hypothetical protein